MPRAGPFPPSSQSECVLLVEGREDRHVVEHLYRKRFDAKPPFDVVDKQGYSNLRAAIVPEVIAPDRRAVGIVVDANDDPDSRWTAVKGRLRRAFPGMEFGTPSPSGTIVNTEPRIGVWLWPDNGSAGEIEDFVVEMIPLGDPVWPLSGQYIEGIAAEDRRFSEGKTARAKLHAWLAAREDPRRMGTAIRAGDLEVDGALATRFAEWLQRLFGKPDRARG